MCGGGGGQPVGEGAGSVVFDVAVGLLESEVLGSHQIVNHHGW